MRKLALVVFVTIAALAQNRTPSTTGTVDVAPVWAPVNHGPIYRLQQDGKITVDGVAVTTVAGYKHALERLQAILRKYPLCGGPALDQVNTIFGDIQWQIEDEKK